MTDETDRRFLAGAIRLGAGALGTTWPNPAVGAIVVREGRVVGRGRTAPGGSPHGEPHALAEAGTAAKGATMYVSLEPCSHHGRTPPCADAIIEAGIARIVAAGPDPDPRVAGRGFARLTTAGIEVASNVLAAEAGRVQAGHISRVQSHRPHVVLKLAISADEAIGRAGERQVAVTGDIARRHVHALRSRFDAILVGSGTVEADDPELTCRLPGLEARSPVRIVLDSKCRLTSERRIFGGTAPTWLVSVEDDSQSGRGWDVTSPLRGGRNSQAEGAANFGRGPAPDPPHPPPEAGEAGFDLPSGGRLGEIVASADHVAGAVDPARLRHLSVPLGDSGGIDLNTCLTRLAEEGITRLLVEGGARVARAFLQADLVDEALIFRSPIPLGGDIIPALAGLPVALFDDPTRFRRLHRRMFGADRLTRYERIR